MTITESIVGLIRQGHTHREIAAELGIGIGSVSRHRRAAVDQLAEVPVDPRIMAVAGKRLGRDLKWRSMPRRRSTGSTVHRSRLIRLAQSFLRLDDASRLEFLRWAERHRPEEDEA